MSLSQLRPTLIDPRLLSPAMVLFNKLSRGILLRVHRPPKWCKNDRDSHSMLVNRQPQTSKDVNTHKKYSFSPTGSAAEVGRQRIIGTWNHGGYGTDDHKD